MIIYNPTSDERGRFATIPRDMAQLPIVRCIDTHGRLRGVLRHNGL